MAEIIHIHHKPTFDLNKIRILQLDRKNSLCYFESIQVYKFDGVYGNLENRSRIIRLGKNESKFVEQIISATIDAGYCGHLVWKTKLTGEGLEVFKSNTEVNSVVHFFEDCQQIHLFSSPAGNYYNGTNQTTLEPDIIFTTH